jgi:hypothetical protein
MYHFSDSMYRHIRLDKMIMYYKKYFREPRGLSTDLDILEKSKKNIMQLVDDVDFNNKYDSLLREYDTLIQKYNIRENMEHIHNLFKAYHDYDIDMFHDVYEQLDNANIYGITRLDEMV